LNSTTIHGSADSVATASRIHIYAKGCGLALDWPGGGGGALGFWRGHPRQAGSLIGSHYIMIEAPSSSQAARRRAKAPEAGAEASGRASSGPIGLSVASPL